MNTNGFKKEGLNFEDIVTLIVNEEPFKKFLKDVQTEYRVNRAMGPDEGDMFLHFSYCVDDILSRFAKLEEVRKQYLEQKKREEEEKLQKQLEKEKKDV